MFLYAGPACSASSGIHYGDSVLYFSPLVDEELAGHACPFDTGSCRPASDGGFLQPFAGEGAAACLAQIDDSSVPIAGWRDRMRGWLVACYEDPERYLETGVDRYINGEPDRTVPPEILENNGERGRARHGKCADRRAWTWELRTTKAVGLRHLSVIHLPGYLIDEEALRRVERMGSMDRPPRLIAVRSDHETGAESLYRDSGRILRLFVEGKVDR